MWRGSSAPASSSGFASAGTERAVRDARPFSGYLRLILARQALIRTGPSAIRLHGAAAHRVVSRSLPLGSSNDPRSVGQAAPVDRFSRGDIHRDPDCTPWGPGFRRPRKPPPEFHHYDSHRVGRLACGVSGDVAADAGRRRGDGGEEGICVRPSRDPQAPFSPSRQGRGPRIRSTAYPRGCDASIGVASVADNHRSASLRPRRLPLHARARPASGSPLAGE